MQTLFHIGLINALVATILALMVFALSRRWRNPVVIHALCLLVLLKFVTPPLIGVLVPTEVAAIDEPIEPVEPVEFQDVEPASSASHGPDEVGAVLSEPIVNEFAAAMSIEPTSEPELDEADELNAPSTFAPGMPTVVVDSPTADAISSIDVEKATASVAMPEQVAWWTAERLAQVTKVLQWIWAVGTIAFALYIAQRFLVVARILRASSEPAPWLQQAVDDVARRLGLSRSPAIRIVDAEMSPVVYCPLFRAHVLIPQRVVNEFSRPQLETILAHELAHLRRRDHRVRQFELLISTLFWWCPVVWWVGRQLRRAEEACCDAEVLRAFPKAGRMYAHVLLKTVEMLRSNQASVVPIGSTFGHTSELRRRIEQILDARHTAKWTWSARALIVAAACLLPISLRATGNESAPPQQTADSAFDVFADDGVAAPEPNRTAPPENESNAAIIPPAKSDDDKTLTSDVSPKLLQVLKEWEAKAATRKRVHVKFHRRLYDATFSVEKIAEGELDFDVPDRGRIAFRGVQPAKGQVSPRKDAKTGKAYGLEADASEQWICDAHTVWIVSEAEKTVDELELPDSWKGSIVTDGPLPFLHGLAVKEALQRYEWQLSSDMPSNRPSNEIWLDVKPRLSKDAANWSRFKLVLDSETYFPKFWKCVDPSGNLETVFQFEPPQINAVSVDSALYAPPTGPEWKLHKFDPVIQADLLNLQDAYAAAALTWSKFAATLRSARSRVDALTQASPDKGTPDSTSPTAGQKTASPEADSASPPQWGNLKGRIVYQGNANGQLAVGPNGVLRNVVVYLRDKAPVHSSYDASARNKVTITMGGKPAVPHIALLRTTQTLEFWNDGSVVIAPHWAPIRNKAVEVVLEPGKEFRFEGPFQQESVPTTLLDEVKKQGGPSYVLVLDNPYMAVTAGDGTFEIANLPVGEWSFALWHESGGVIKLSNEKTGRLKVKIQSGDNDVGTITLDDRQLTTRGVPAPQVAVVPPDKEVSSAATPAGQSGTLTGRFIYDGPAPERMLIKPDKDAAAFEQTPIYDESLVVGKEGGLANVFVYVRDKNVPVPPDDVAHPPAKITARDGRFEPHAMVVRTQQKFELVNDMPVVENFHSQASQGTPFNMLVTQRSQSEVAGSSRRENYPAKVTSDFHFWMNAWILVRDNPYAVVTAEDGSFRIDNLPVGEWEFQLWHEKKGYVELPGWAKGRQKISIKPGTNDLGSIKVSPDTLERIEIPEEFRTRTPDRAPVARNVERDETPASRRWQTHRRNRPYGELGFVGEEYGPHWEFVRLATHPPVQHQLKLSQEQIDELKPVFKSLLSKDGEWSSGRAKPQLLQLEFDITNRVLTEAQRTRVYQIMVQRHGLEVLLQKDMRTGLGLSPDQVAKIKSAWDAHGRRVQNGRPGNAGRESAFQAWRSALEVLTDEQHDKFDKLTGLLIDTTPERNENKPSRDAAESNGSQAMKAVADADENPWSEPVNGLQARMHFAAKRKLNDTVIIDTYLEFRNVADNASVMEFDVQSGDFTFTVTDAKGNEFPKYNGPYDGSSVDPGTIRLPYEGNVRFNISMQGAGISRDAGAMLDLISATAWTFPREPKSEYFLSCKLEMKGKPRTITDGGKVNPFPGLWAGTLQIPKTRIPLKEFLARKPAAQVAPGN